jgi:amino acid permease
MKPRQKILLLSILICGCLLAKVIAATITHAFIRPEIGMDTYRGIRIGTPLLALITVSSIFVKAKKNAFWRIGLSYLLLVTLVAFSLIAIGFQVALIDMQTRKANLPNLISVACSLAILALLWIGSAILKRQQRISSCKKRIVNKKR